MRENSSPATYKTKCPSPTSLLRRYSYQARKSLGQNFLVHPSLALEIVKKAAIPPEGPVIELGVGLGTLTWALAQTYPRVIGYELDQQLLAILKKEKFLPPHVELRQGDILKLDYQSLAKEFKGPLVLFGNLPYYLSSRLLFRLIRERKVLKSATFMFQKEVGERLIASQGGKKYGPLGVLLKLTSRLTPLLTLSPAQFYPRPEVASMVLKIEFYREDIAEEALVFEVVKKAFTQRRKTLARNLIPLGGLKLEQAKEILQGLGYPEKVRAEDLAPEEFVRLALKLKDYLKAEKGV